MVGKRGKLRLTGQLFTSPARILMFIGSFFTPFIKTDTIDQKF